jgi:hypothetical protein
MLMLDELLENIKDYLKNGLSKDNLEDIIKSFNAFKSVRCKLFIYKPEVDIDQLSARLKPILIRESLLFPKKFPKNKYYKEYIIYFPELEEEHELMPDVVAELNHLRFNQELIDELANKILNFYESFNQNKSLRYYGKNSKLAAAIITCCRNEDNTCPVNIGPYYKLAKSFINKANLSIHRNNEEFFYNAIHKLLRNLSLSENVKRYSIGFYEKNKDKIIFDAGVCGAIVYVGALLLGEYKSQPEISKAINHSCINAYRTKIKSLIKFNPENIPKNNDAVFNHIISSLMKKLNWSKEVEDYCLDYYKNNKKKTHFFTGYIGSLVFYAGNKFNEPRSRRNISDAMGLKKSFPDYHLL